MEVNTTMLLAVDTAHKEPGQHVTGAVAMVTDLAAKTGDKVVVVHVHEYASGRFGRIKVDCADEEGERLVAGIVADLRAAGISAEGEVRDADFGHVSRAILAAGHDHDARIMVLGSHTKKDLPSVTFGSVASRLLHLSSRPVLIVPMHRAERQEASADAQPADAAATR
jgi:nucleotide-binding universal stress UspA family protein